MLNSECQLTRKYPRSLSGIYFKVSTLIKGNFSLSDQKGISSHTMLMKANDGCRKVALPPLNVWVSSYKLDRGGRHGICSGMHRDAGMGMITKRVLINEVIVINLGYPHKISSVGTTTRRLSVRVE